MKLNIFDINKFIQANHCKEVTSPIFFLFDGTSNQDGIFSTDIFGVTDTDRKNRFAYVDLHGHFLHPLVYGIFTKRMGSLKDVASYQKYAIVVNKKIQIVPEDFKGAETGIDFFYDHFHEIEWINEIEEEAMDSLDKKTRLKFLNSLEKNEFFVDKWLVIPPFYREVSSENQSAGDEINGLYKKLISRTSSLKNGFGIEIFGNATKFAIQQLIYDIFNETTRVIKGSKNNLFRSHLLGKTIDFTASNVITSPQISMSESPDDMPVNFGYCSFPLATLMSLFQPFFVSEVGMILESYGQYVENVKLNDIKKFDRNQYTPDKVAKLIKLFIKSNTERFSPVQFEYRDNSGEMKTVKIQVKEGNSKKDIEDGKFVIRDLTYTDLFYLAANQCLTDKHVYVTRYPVLNFQNIFPSRIKIMSTSRTRKAYIELAGEIFDADNEKYAYMRKYPYIKTDVEGMKKVPNTYYEFTDVFVVGNEYLDSLGGDYDGDMLYLKGVFTKEANAEAEKLIEAKTNILGADGKPTRGLSKIGKDAILSLYELTKDGK